MQKVGSDSHDVVLEVDRDKVFAHVFAYWLILYCSATLGKEAFAIHGCGHMNVFFELGWDRGAGDVLDGEYADDFASFICYDQTIDPFVQNGVERVADGDIFADGDGFFVIDFVDEH